MKKFIRSIPKPKPKSTKVDLAKKLADRSKFLPVPKNYYQVLPPGTHIGYVYRNYEGDLMPIVSAFIKEHYTSGGLGGMLIKCGTREYANPYDSFIQVYIYAADRVKVETAMKRKLANEADKPDLEDRLKRLEVKLENVTNCITRSISMTELKKPEIKKEILPKPVPVKKSKSLTHDKPKRRKISLQ